MILRFSILISVFSLFIEKSVNFFEYNFTETSNGQLRYLQTLPKPKVPITRASNIIPNCSSKNIPSGNHPLIDLYCGMLGQKTIHIYIQSVDVHSKSVVGYSIVGKNRTNFDGHFTLQEHKAARHQSNNIVDVNGTVYHLILKEPSNLNKNGVFDLTCDISDVSRTGFGTWTSYDGMLYREIKIIDRLNN